MLYEQSLIMIIEFDLYQQSGTRSQYHSIIKYVPSFFVLGTSRLSILNDGLYLHVFSCKNPLNRLAFKLISSPWPSLL